MRITYLSLVFFIVQNVSVFGQKFGYVDAEAVLTRMESYQKAQADIAEASQKWQNRLDEMFVQVRKLKDDYYAEKPILTDDIIEEKEEEIKLKEKEAMDYQRKVFGPGGLLFTRQGELIKPALEELQEALQKIVRKENLQFIFSNREGNSILYAHPRHDYTEEVLEELGLLSNEEENPENPQNGK